MGKLHEEIRKVVIDLQKIDGYQLRRVSSANKEGTIPSLTIIAELKELGYKRGDWVLVGIEDGKIIIKKPE